MAPQLRRNTKFRLDNASNFAVKKRKEIFKVNKTTSFS